jgi:hypothetical protein
MAGGLTKSADAVVAQKPGAARLILLAHHPFPQTELMPSPAGQICRSVIVGLSAIRGLLAVLLGPEVVLQHSSKFVLEIENSGDWSFRNV